MVRFSALPAAAVTLFLFGVEASPCKPSTTGVTSIAESSTVVPDSTATSLDSIATTTETSAAESVSTIASDTTIVSVDITTTTALADSTTAAQEEPATTTGALACVETQLFVNPGFDDNAEDITAPWTVSNGVVTTIAHSAPYALSYTSSNGSPRDGVIVSQSLSNLYGTYEFSYYYRTTYISPNADYTCNTELRVGDSSIYGAFYDGVGDWRFDSVIFSDINVARADVKLILTCSGEYQQIQANIDSLGFRRVCSQ